MKRSEPRTPITLRVPKDVLSWYRERGRDEGGRDYRDLMNQVLADRVRREYEAITEESRRRRAYERAYRRWQRDMKKPRHLGIGGKTTWTRDELHERHPEKKAK